MFRKNKKIKTEKLMHFILFYKMNSISEFKINWNIVDKTESYNKRFGLRQYNSKVKCDYNVGNNEIGIDRVLMQLEITLNEIIHRILRGASEEDRIRVSLNNHHLDFSIYVPFRKVKDFTTEALLNEIIKVSQSRKDFVLYGLIDIDVVHVRSTQIGGGRSKSRIIDLDKWRTNSKKVISITKDGLCVPRSIVVSKAFVDGVKGTEWRRIRSDIKKEQYNRAIELCERAQVSIPSNGVNYEDFIKFQSVLSPEYQLIVTTPPKNFYFVGQPTAEKQIFIFLSENHCDALLSITAFLRCDYYCKKCIKGYVGRTNHECIGTCSRCFGSNKCLPCEPIICKECNREFVSLNCFTRHKSETRICSQIRKCSICLKIVRGKNHECGKKKCKICRTMVPFIDHNCFITPNSLSKIQDEDRREKVFIFYDFESQQVSQKLNEYVHKPNLCVVNICCDYCWRTDLKDRSIEWCSFCGQKEYIFRGSGTVKEFSIFLFGTYTNYLKDRRKYSKLKNDITAYVIAHNSRSYDSQFILKYCVNNRITPNVLKKGTKILSMKVGNLKFLDSLSFLPMPLRKLPETFGLENDLQKGCFPFLFNTIGNENFIGKWPDIEFYDPDFMNEKERKGFLQWYDGQKDKTFNFKEELEKYCRSDTNILMRCVMLFREIFKNVSGIDPLCRSVTIAMATMEVFKTNYLKPNIIAITPPNGYDPKRKQSYVGSVWLDYIESTLNVTIKREQKIGRYYVDGVIMEALKVYEFYGCGWHGCFDCYPTRRSVICNPFNGQSMENLFQYTQNREQFLKNEGFSLETIWECKLKKERKLNKELDNYFIKHIRNLKDSKIRPPLDVRDSFFGGRTCAVNLFHEINQSIGEKIQYMDVTSLYPFVVKRKKFPVGHPIRITKNINSNISVYDGFIFCKILPPKNLYFPVLPVRIKNRLVFPLCYECASEQNNNKCQHNNNQRAIIGTYTTMELNKAIEKNYEIIEIYEVWNYDLLSPINENEPGIFTQFINDFIKIKIESSGWPRENMSETEKTQYIELFKEKEGIDLDRDKISYNPGLRSLGKLVVNSFWGKMGQKPNHSKTEYITEPQSFFKLLEDSTVIVNDAMIISDEVLQVSYEKETVFVEPPSHSSIVIASFVTSYARLELYKLLDFLDKRCQYFDTDSVIFTSKAGEANPETGPFLGELTNELSTKEEPDAYITKFASCGSKNYSYEVYYPRSKTRKYFCKVKGLSLNFSTSNIVNFDTMKKLIDESVNQESISEEIDIDKDAEREIEVPQKVIRVSPFLEIKTKIFNKKYRFVYDKRRIISNEYATVPFGYHHISDS
jgi:G:T-mismatch repair DNA endonuclease (very short patch repair protein)